LRYPNSQLSVIAANSDSRIKEILNVAKGLLTDIQKSPYRDRIFVVLDAVHSASLPEHIARMGVAKENIITWPKNGIEHLYPPAILDEIFGHGAEITIAGDIVSRNGISYNKGDLAENVVKRLQRDTVMHPQFEKLLLQPLEERQGFVTGNIRAIAGSA